METAAADTVSTGNFANFQKIMMPMIRRVIPGTIATELVGVQPLTGPTGLIYSMRYTYMNGAAGTEAGSTINAGDEAVPKGNQRRPANNVVSVHYNLLNGRKVKDTIQMLIDQVSHKDGAWILWSSGGRAKIVVEANSFWQTTSLDQLNCLRHIKRLNGIREIVQRSALIINKQLPSHLTPPTSIVTQLKSEVQR
jgi:hypothetical protein